MKQNLVITLLILIAAAVAVAVPWLAALHFVSLIAIAGASKIDSWLVSLLAPQRIAAVGGYAVAVETEDVYYSRATQWAVAAIAAISLWLVPSFAVSVIAIVWAVTSIVGMWVLWGHIAERLRRFAGI
jgi:hypothetical protein